MPDVGVITGEPSVCAGPMSRVGGMGLVECVSWSVMYNIYFSISNICLIL